MGNASGRRLLYLFAGALVAVTVTAAIIFVGALVSQAQAEHNRSVTVVAWKSGGYLHIGGAMEGIGVSVSPDFSGKVLGISAAMDGATIRMAPAYWSNGFLTARAGIYFPSQANLSAVSLGTVEVTVQWADANPTTNSVEVEVIPGSNLSGCLWPAGGLC